jgi:periplasmic protein TonB
MSDLGNLTICLVDSDTEAASRARRLRHKALVASLALEAGLVAAMLLWPLITPGVLPRWYVVTPAPPYHGGGGASHPHEAAHPHPLRNHLPTPCIFCAPPIIPPHVSSTDGGEPPAIPDDGGGSGPGLGPAIPGGGPPIPGADDGRSMPPAPPASAPSRPLQISGGVMEASLIHRVQPIYPPIARAARISGIVQLRAIIGKDGAVRELEVVSGNALLAQAALAAVREWRYQPTLLSGNPVEVETRITVNFVLE